MKIVIDLAGVRGLDPIVDEDARGQEQVDLELLLAGGVGAHGVDVRATADPLAPHHRGVRGGEGGDDVGGAGPLQRRHDAVELRKLLRQAAGVGLGGIGQVNGLGVHHLRQGLEVGDGLAAAADDQSSNSFERLDALLREGRISEEEYNNLWRALRGQRTLGAAPGAPAGIRLWQRMVKEGGFASGRELIIFLICEGCQVLGLALALCNVPVIPAIAGFAAIIAYLLTPKEPAWIKQLGLVAAICGFVTILFSIARGA